MDACEPQIEHPPSGAFDVVVLGTGLMESLVAACVLAAWAAYTRTPLPLTRNATRARRAAAKAGKTVLHVDHEAHYGAEVSPLCAAHSSSSGLTRGATHRSGRHSARRP